MEKKKLVKYFVVDAFAESAFKGNQAAVCFVEEDRDDQWYQCVASEFNLSETCFLTRIPSSIPRFRLRWFTPQNEVELCGHATLASAHTLFTTREVESEIIEFETLSGLLTAKRIPENHKAEGSNGTSPDNEPNKGFFIELNFPVDPIIESASADIFLINKALKGASVVDIKRTATLNDLLIEVPSAKCVEDLQLDSDALGKIPMRGMIVTGIAPSGSRFDFYSRFFAPSNGIDEDPVTGSAHCSLAPYWWKKLGKHDFVAYQASPRGGVLNVHMDDQNQRVLLRGKAITVMEGTLLV